MTPSRTKNLPSPLQKATHPRYIQKLSRRLQQLFYAAAMPRGRPAGSKNISHAKIAAIIVLCTKCLTPFVEIATNLGILNVTAGQWFSRIKKQANNSVDLKVLLDAIP